jgi:predicted DNA-binding transcriptional regulator AlpA
MIALRIAPDDPAAPRLLLTARDAARALAVSERTLWGLTQPRGPIPCVRVGARSVRYSVADLEHWIAQQRAGPPGG